MKQPTERKFNYTTKERIELDEDDEEVYKKNYNPNVKPDFQLYGLEEKYPDQDTSAEGYNEQCQNNG